jgi:hypothetical protein
VIVVGVRIRPYEAGLELELDQRQLVDSNLDRGDAVRALEPFAVAGRKEDRLRPRSAAARRSVDAVEAAGLTAVTLPQVLGEAAPGRVEVEKTRARRAPEPVHDLLGSADERARRQQLLLVVDEHREPALDDVERIHVQTMEVGGRSVAGIREERFRDAQLLEVGLDHDPAAEQRLALARPVHHASHLGRV